MAEISSPAPMNADGSAASAESSDAADDQQAGAGTGKIPPQGTSSAGNRPPNAPRSAGAPDDAGADAAQMLADDRSELGTGFIPNSPETTAELMAGEDAAAQAAALLGSDYGAKPEGSALASELADAGEPGDEAGQGQTEKQGQSKGKRQARSTSSGSSPGSSKDGESTNNLAVKQQAPEPGANTDLPGKPTKDAVAARDADGAARALGQESWFAKLPPDLRKAIRAKAQRPPPRNYEQKLQKYFESLD